tara:strand:+ start:378 stop:761 length:384 start_codon:yes stop_codon:yes gene_type:complete
MSNVNTDGLPPEMQARIAQIIEGAKQKAIAQHQPLPESPHQAAIAQPAAPVAPPAPPVPNLMDHTISLRQEVAALSQQVAAMGQVVEACGQAVGAMYSMFQQQTTPTDSGSTYSQNFQEQVEVGDDY